MRPVRALFLAVVTCVVGCGPILPGEQPSGETVEPVCGVTEGGTGAQQHEGVDGPSCCTWDAALAKLPTLSWRGGAVARMALHIADAEHHAEKSGKVAEALQLIRARGIHLYPVAASGASTQAEFSFRQEAEGHRRTLPLPHR